MPLADSQRVIFPRCEPLLMDFVMRLIATSTVFLLLLSISGCSSMQTDASASLSKAVEKSPSCTDWQSQWSHFKYGDSTMWIVDDWRQLSRAETLEFAEQIFEQTDEDLKVVFGESGGTPILQSDIPESQRYFVDIGKIVQLPDITGNGHCDFALEIQPIRTDISKEDDKVLCNDSATPLCVYHPSPRVSFSNTQGVFFYRLSRLSILYEGRKEEGPQLVGEIGAFIDLGTEKIVSSNLWSGRLREEEEDDFLFLVGPANRETEMEIAYHPFGFLPDILPRSLYSETKRDIIRPIHFKTTSLTVEFDFIILDGLDPWQHLEEEIYALELTLRINTDGEIFIDGVHLNAYGPVDGGKRPDIELPSEYEELVNLPRGNQLIAFNGVPIEELIQGFREQLSDEGTLDRPVVERQLLRSFGGVLKLALEGQSEEMECAGDDCETYGENIPAEVVELTFRGSDGIEYQVRITPPSLLDPSP